MKEVQTVTATALSLTTAPISKPIPCNTVSSNQYLLAKRYDKCERLHYAEAYIAAADPAIGGPGGRLPLRAWLCAFAV